MELPKRIAVVVAGHAFRVGGQHRRDVADDPGTQISATETHVQFRRALESAGFRVDFYCRAYRSPHDAVLELLYDKVSFAEQAPEYHQGDMLLDAFREIRVDEYDAVVRMRFDMRFADPQDLGHRVARFIAKGAGIAFLFPMHWRELSHGEYFNETYPDQRSTEFPEAMGMPRIADTFFVVQRSHFDVLGRECIGRTTNHAFLARVYIFYKRQGRFVGAEFLYDEPSDTDPAKMPNRVYDLVSRSSASWR